MPGALQRKNLPCTDCRKLPKSLPTIFNAQTANAVRIAVASVFLVGWLLIAGGVFHIVHILRHAEIGSSGNVFGAVCDFEVGHPTGCQSVLGMLTLTLVLAAFLLSSG
jgi:uncharacterized membrane protein HdeD (DUF308 family)